MNPETKLTDNEIKAICNRHGIVYRSHTRINSGFSHEVHRLNDDLLIKLFNSHEPRNYQTELALLQSDLDFPKPKLVANYQSASSRSYIVMSFVPGFSLGSRWHEATDEQRKLLIKDIAQTLRVINQLDPKAINASATDWQTDIDQRINKLLDKLAAKNILNEMQIERVHETVSANKQYLANSKLVPAYWDIHFDNFLVDENFKLQAIIDLENVELVASDYPLFVVQKLTEEPHKYLREEDEKYADIKDYAKLTGWYKTYYPEMFAYDNLNRRVLLYAVMDTLHLLTDWSHVSVLYGKLDQLTDVQNPPKLI